MKHIDLEIDTKAPSKLRLALRKFHWHHGDKVVFGILALFACFMFYVLTNLDKLSGAPCTSSRPCTEQAKRQYCESYQSRTDVRCTGFFVK